MRSAVFAGRRGHEIGAWFVAGVWLVALGACRGPSNGSTEIDARARSDASTVEGPTVDAPARPDAGLADARGPDAPPPDAPPPDGSPPDASPPDAGPADAGGPDATPPTFAFGTYRAAPAFVDVVLDNRQHQVIVAYGDANRLDVVPLRPGGVTTSIATPYRAEHLTYDPIRQQAIVTLPSLLHNPSNPNADGYLGVLDGRTRELAPPLHVPIDPWGIAADGSGYAYVTGGSGQFAMPLAVFLDNGFINRSQSQVRQLTPIRLHPSGTRILGVEWAESPQSLVEIDFLPGIITAVNSSPFSGSTQPCDDLRIDPSGARVFLRCGLVLGGGAGQASSIGAAWTDVAFSPTGDLAYVLLEGSSLVTVYDSTSLVPIRTYDAAPLSVRRLLAGPDYVVLVAEDVVDAALVVLPFSSL